MADENGTSECEDSMLGNNGNIANTTRKYPLDDARQKRKVYTRIVDFINVDKCVKNKDLRDVCPLIIFMLMLGILIILTAVCIGEEPESYNTYNPNLCVPCNQLRYHAEIANIGSSCCAPDDFSYGNLVKQYTHHWYKMKIDEENPTFNYCPSDAPTVSSIKLTGAHIDGKETRSRMVFWNDTRFDTNGLEYKDGYIRVPETALYFVYSQLVFLDTEKSRAEGESVTPYNMLIFTHSITQSTSGMEKTVLRGSNTPEPCGNGSKDRKTSYLGSYMILHEGDELAVKLAGARDLVTESEMNFFGIHKA